MPNNFSTSTPQARDPRTTAILEWLAHAHGRSGSDDASELLDNLTKLRESSAAGEQRLALLDLLQAHAGRICESELPGLGGHGFPVPRTLRQKARTIQEILDLLIHEYVDSLVMLFDPETPGGPRDPETTLRRILQCCGWHLAVSHAISSPDGVGLWGHIHASYRAARRLGIAQAPGTDGEPAIETLYGRLILGAVARPSSFRPDELAFIRSYIDLATRPLEILDTAPRDRDGLFWIDLEGDFPAYAVNRRPPPADVPTLFFAADLVARDAAEQLAALEEPTGAMPSPLPPGAATPGCQATLRRLAELWGNPTKRRFPRRKRSYRSELVSGFAPLWQVLHSPTTTPPSGQWMVTNESPDGYALMHIAGDTAGLAVGEVAAIRHDEEDPAGTVSWQVGLIRWALSENPEHVEIGLQQLAAQAIPARVVRAAEDGGNVSALLLPPSPPARIAPALLLPAGLLSANDRRLAVLIEQGNLRVCEFDVTGLAEQGPSVEVFNLAVAEP
jgi:hypothetical protein